MKYCTKCGAPLKEGAKFCNKCGQPVEQVNNMNTQSIPTVVKEKDQTITNVNANNVNQEMNQAQVNNYQPVTTNTFRLDRSYFDFYVRKLKNPTVEEDVKTPMYYGYIIIAVQALLFALFIGGIVRIGANLTMQFGSALSSSLFGTSDEASEYLNNATLDFAGHFKFFLFAIVLTLIICVVLFGIYNYFLGEKIKYEQVINEYSNYLSLNILLLLIGFVLSLISPAATIVFSLILLLIVPIIFIAFMILVANHSQKAMPKPRQSLYAILIGLLIIIVFLSISTPIVLTI